MIELLVVVAIIGILASLALSALAPAKEKARASACISNHREWITAMLAYATENGGQLPREGHHQNGRTYPNSWTDTESPISADVWYNALIPEYAASNYVGNASRFYQARIFHCPTARFPPGIRTSTQAYFSIAMNSKLINATGEPIVPILTISEILDAPRTAAFLDGRVSEAEPEVDPLQPNSDLGQPAVFASRFAARHEGSGIIAYFDGHVQREAGIKVVETRQGRYRGYAIHPGEIIWTPDPLDTPNPP